VGDWVDELTLDLYYKEGKEISLWRCSEMAMIIKKGRYSFLSFQVTGKKRNFIFNCTRR
jgi:hypothetical protein